MIGLYTTAFHQVERRDDTGVLKQPVTTPKDGMFNGNARPSLRATKERGHTRANFFKCRGEKSCPCFSKSLGPLGLEWDDYRRTRCPSVERIRKKAS